MKTIRFLIIFALTLSLGIFMTNLVQNHYRASDEKLLAELIKVHEQYTQAYLAGDKETCDKLLADEFVDLVDGQDGQFTYFDLNHKSMSFNQRVMLLSMIGLPDKKKVLDSLRPVKHGNQTSSYENLQLRRDADSTFISFESDRKIFHARFVWRDNRWQIVSTDSYFKR